MPEKSNRGNAAKSMAANRPAKTKARQLKGKAAQQRALGNTMETDAKMFNRASSAKKAEGYRDAAKKTEAQKKKVESRYKQKSAGGQMSRGERSRTSTKPSQF